MKKFSNIVEWVFKIIVAFILLQTLYFKFSAHEQSVELFSKLGVEPLGRIFTGIIELVASILLFIPKKTWLGALIALLTMGGAIIAHLTILGINYPDGVLFWLAVLVFVLSAFLLMKNRKVLSHFIK